MTLTDTDTAPRRHRLAIVTAIVAALAAVLLGAGSGTANAATPAVTYASSYNSCTTIRDGASSTSTMDFSRPVAAANYSGTTYLYWSAEVDAYVGGAWHVVSSGYAGAYAHIWGHSGSQLTPIYWGDTANNYGVAANLTTGYSYRVIGQTYWWNGSSWFVSNRTLEAACNF